MSTLVQIRDVPEEVHRRLKAKAAMSGMSLSAYLRREVEQLAAIPTPEELQRRFEELEPVRSAESVADARQAAREAEGWQ